MPAPIIKIYDRPNIQTEKCLGYGMVRKCKASKLQMELEDSFLPVGDGRDMFDQFKQLDFNYKGNTAFNPSMFENFNSFRVKASGTINIGSDFFDIWFFLYDASGTALGSVRNNYGNGHHLLNNNHLQDWFLDVEITYFLREGKHNFIVSGNYTHSNDVHPRKLDVSLVSIMGGIYDITENKLYFDFKVLNTETCQIKDFSVDFVE